VAISLEESIAILLEKVKIQKKVLIPLEDCYNRILAEDIIADTDFPPFDRSPLDGYAVRMEDVQHASPLQPIVLKQVDYVPAGSWPSIKVETGMATRIMTGAKIPEGADAIIRLEDTAVHQEMVSIFTATGANHNICRQGEEICNGQIILKKGIIIKDGALGILAMLGKSKPLVYERPKVAILATGTEIIGIEQPLEKGKIRNSNNYMLMAKVREAGGSPLLLGQVQDDINEMEKKLTGHENIDIYITTGGASVGDYDLMEQLFSKMGIPLLFTRLAMKPGMPVIAGFWHGVLMVALSGNPASANVSFEVLLRPLLRKISGAELIERPRAQAKMKKAFTKKSKHRRFIWARCEHIDGVLYAEPIEFQGNGMLSGALPANALLDISSGSGYLEVGTTVVVRLLTD